jgi:hypothetical protein
MDGGGVADAVRTRIAGKCTCQAKVKMARQSAWPGFLSDVAPTCLPGQTERRRPPSLGVPARRDPSHPKLEALQRDLGIGLACLLPRESESQRYASESGRCTSESG